MGALRHPVGPGGGAGPPSDRGPRGRGRRRHRDRPRGAQDRRPVRQLHGHRADRGARCRTAAHAARARRRGRRPGRARTGPRSLGAGGLGRAVRLRRRHRQPQLRPLPAPPRPGRPRPSRRVLLPRRQVRRDPGQLPRPPDHDVLARRARPPRGARRHRAAGRDPAGRGPLGALRDPRRADAPTTCSPAPGWPRCARPSTSRRTSRPWVARRRRSPRSSCGSPSYLEHLAVGARGGAAGGLARLGCGSGWCAPWSATCRRSSSRPTSTSTAAPSAGTPEIRARWKRGVSMGARARWARPWARGTSSDTSRRWPSSAWTSSSPTCSRAYRRSYRRPRLDGRGDQGAGLREARPTFRPKIGYPEGVARLLRAREVSPEDLLANVAGQQPPSRPTASCAKIGSPGRPRRVVHAALRR